MSVLAKKLQVKPNKSWLFYNAPENYLSILEPLPDGVRVNFSVKGDFDGIQLFVFNSDELKTGLAIISPLLKPDTIFWVSYPKKSSGAQAGPEMMGIWEEAAKYGLRIVASAAINDLWTALRLKPVVQVKVSEFRNEMVKNNEYAAFINLDKRCIVLPADMQQVLGDSSAAMSFYESLSFSNKREYVVWILSAKQEKTRMDRLDKMLLKLLSGKKTPAEK